MIKRLSKASVSLVEKYLPDPFLFAIGLTFVVFILGILFTENGYMDMAIYFGEGFWDLLEFAMQMCLILVTGHALASSSAFNKLLTNLASIPNSPGTATAFTAFVAAIACWINWGFGLVIGALFAKEIAKQVKDVDYRLLIASAYSGFIVWHAGLSGSIPLTVATDGHFMEEALGIIPTANTIFTAYNLIIAIVLIITIPYINKKMLPDKEDRVIVDPEILKEEDEESEEETLGVKGDTFADKIENSRIVSLLIGVIGLTYIVYYFSTEGFALTLNIVNFVFLFTGIILHGTPRAYIDAFAEGVKGASGIILQFPFYAGIMGMMTGSGLAVMFSEFFVNISTQVTLPFFSFISAGIVNFFVPSGGGQWSVQAPIMVPAAQEIGADVARTAMAVAWGDAWTNMIQPFWALPALGIAGLGARDIMGYCIIILLWTFIIAGVGLTVIPLII